MNQINDRQLMDIIYRHDFTAFVEKAFAVVYSSQRLEPNWHIEAVCLRLQRIVEGREPPRLILNMPPRSLKSFITSVCLPAWILLKDPSHEIIVASYNEELSCKFSRLFRQLMKSGFMQRLARGIFDRPRKVTESEYETRQSGGRFATSVGGTLTGRGADLLIIDDPLKADEAASEVSRKSVRDWFGSAAISRRNKPGKSAMIVAMQRVHEDDLSGHLLEKGWPSLVIPAIADQAADYALGGGFIHHRQPGDVLQSGRDTLEELESIRLQQGSYLFSAQYLQAPLPAEGNLVKRDYIGRYNDPPDLTRCRYIYCSCDPSGKSGTHNDYTAILVAAVVGRNVYILDVIRGHYDCLQIVRHIQELSTAYRTTVNIIETTGMGEFARQEIERGGRIDIRGVNTTSDKITRLSRVIARIEGGHVLLPNEAPWLADFERELLGFPNTRNDDQVDALIFILEDLAERERYDDQTYNIVIPDMHRDEDFFANRFSNRGHSF